MTYFHRPITIEANQLTAITNAYNISGVTPPNRAVKILEAVGAEPTASQVATDLAREALTHPDPQAYIADALARVQRAQAADTLRAALRARVEKVTRENVPAMLDTAAGDLTPAFNRLVKALIDAAKKLPETNPLDESAAVEHGHAPALKAAREALIALGAYAAIHQQSVPGDAPTALITILPLIDLPATVVEAREAEALTHRTVTPANELAPTLAVRALGTAAQRDIDVALVDVARGKYEGTTFSLATSGAMLERAARVRDAYRTRIAADGSRPLRTNNERAWVRV